MNKKYIFVAGCPGSGTSAFVSFLLETKKVAIFMERYQKYWKTYHRFPEKAFDKEKILNIEEGETHYDNISRFKPNIIAMELYDNAEFVGDKIPSLYENFDNLFSQFPNAKVFFLYRNPYSIAESYKRRALDSGIKDFNSSIKALLDLYNKKNEIFFQRIYIVEYELFVYNSLDIKHIKLFLESNLDFPIIDFKKNYNIIEKPSLLTSVEKKLISELVDWNLVEQMRKVIDEQRLYYYRLTAPQNRRIEWYHKNDLEKLRANYGSFMIEGCPYVFRGSKLPIKDRFLVALGSAFTFGRLIKKPYSEILEEKIQLPVVNLGIGGARPSAYLCYPSIIDFCKKAELVICEVMSARGYTNPVWEEKFPFTNFGIPKIPPSILTSLNSQLKTPSKLKFLIEKMQKNEAIFFDRLEILYEILSVEDLHIIRDIVVHKYIQDLLLLLREINKPTILIYLNKRGKKFACQFNSKPSSYSEWTGDFPHFVDEVVIEILKSKGYDVIEIYSSEGMPFIVKHWETEEPVDLFPWNDPPYINTYYPSQEIHDLTANELLKHPYIVKLQQGF